jgi:hypothetical protein
VFACALMQTLAMKSATHEALQKVAGAVGVGAAGRSGAEGGAHDNFDFFDPKEQVRLGLKTL